MPLIDPATSEAVPCRMPNEQGSGLYEMTIVNKAIARIDHGSNLCEGDVT